MADLFPTKDVSNFGDWLTYGTDYVPGLGFYILIAVYVVFFIRMYNGRNMNSSSTAAMWITTLISFVFFWLDFVKESVVAATITLSVVGVVITFLNKRAGA